MATVAIIQARMTSSRFPGKVMADLADQPMLAYMLARVRAAGRLDSIWVATTTNSTDDPVATLCEELAVPVFRGDEADVLGRFAGAAEVAGADAIVRLTADCPMIDPSLIDKAVDNFAAENFDYLSNAIEMTYPDGMDVEVFSRAALTKAHDEASEKFHREHVTPYMRTGCYDSVETGVFNIGFMRASADFSHLRWTVDTEDDLVRVRNLVAELPEGYGWLDAVALVTRRPELLSRAASPTATDVYLRPAAITDSGILFGWVNQPDSIAASLQTASPVDHQEHEAWFTARLADKKCGIWIAERGGALVGQVRLTQFGDALEVAIYVACDARGGGAATRMLDLVAIEASKHWPGLPLRARVKHDNWTSRSLFARAGYGGMKVEPGHLVLTRAPLSPLTAHS